MADDAVHSLGLLVRRPVVARVVTSDFHVERARHIFETGYHRVTSDIVGVVADIPPDELEVSRMHEAKALAGLVSQKGMLLQVEPPASVN